MAVYETDKSRSTTLAPLVGAGWARAVVCETAIVAMTTAMIDNANDDVGLFWVPAGAVVVGAYLSCTDMDTGGPTLSIDVGDSADEDRLIALGLAGGTGLPVVTAHLNTSGHLYKYTAKTQIRAYINTAATTPAAGTLKFSLMYFIDPEFNTTPLVAA